MFFFSTMCRRRRRFSLRNSFPLAYRNVNDFATGIRTKNPVDGERRKHRPSIRRHCGTEIYNTLTHTSREQSASTGIDRGGGGGKMAERDGNGGWWGVSTGGVIFTPFHSQFSTNDVVSDLTEAAAASAVARFSSLRSSIFAAAGATLPRCPFSNPACPKKP